VARYGPEKADKLLRLMLRHYRRLAYVRMPGAAGVEQDREAVREIAAKLELEPVELGGSDEWLRALVAHEWDERFVVVEPGQAIERRHFAPA
jgi:hypothetical protein